MWEKIVEAEGVDGARSIMRENDDFGFIRNYLTSELAATYEVGGTVYTVEDVGNLLAEVDFNGPEPKLSDIRILDKREKAHLYHPDFSPDGLYVTYSVGPGGRTAASGPGTA